MRFEVPPTSHVEDDEYIASETRKYNSQFTDNKVAPISVYCRDEAGELIGGLTGKTYWKSLDIGFLWVDESMRYSGIASQLLTIAEKEAKLRGCQFSILDTYEFQALGFYLKHGYQEFGRLEGYCEKYQRYYLRKSLQ